MSIKERMAKDMKDIISTSYDKDNYKQYAVTPGMNIDGLNKMADFLDKNRVEIGEVIGIKVSPDFLKSAGKFLNERKKMKYEHQELEKKMQMVADVADKQYNVAMAKLHNELGVQLASVRTDSEVELYRIQKQFDAEMQKICMDYMLKYKGMDSFYKELEAQRRKDDEHFWRMINILESNRKNMQKAMDEMEQLCLYLKNKIYVGQATEEDRVFYMNLLQMRMQGIVKFNHLILKMMINTKDEQG